MLKIIIRAQKSQLNEIYNQYLYNCNVFFYRDNNTLFDFSFNNELYKLSGKNYFIEIYDMMKNKIVGYNIYKKHLKECGW